MGKTTKRIAQQMLADNKAPAALKTQASNYLNDCRAGSYNSTAPAGHYGFFSEHHGLCRSGLASSDNVRQVAQAYDYQPLTRAAKTQAKQEDGCGCCIIS